jgi:hypothetical protein
MKKSTLIKVICDSQGMPYRVKDQPVQAILEHWQDTGRWWAGESEKTFYRLVCKNGSVYEIFFDQQHWYLYKTYD